MRCSHLMEKGLQHSQHFQKVCHPCAGVIHQQFTIIQVCCTGPVIDLMQETACATVSDIMCNCLHLGASFVLDLVSLRFFVILRPICFLIVHGDALCCPVVVSRLFLPRGHLLFPSQVFPSVPICCSSY